MLVSAYVETWMGWFRLTGSELGLYSAELLGASPPEVAIVPEVLANACAQLAEYFEGRRRTFDLVYDWSGAPEYHKLVWQRLVWIPYGTTCSYQEIAEALGDKNAVRAVGQANRNNRIAVIVPCHRVIAKSGDLQGYFYGKETKGKLLHFENPARFALQTELF